MEITRFTHENTAIPVPRVHGVCGSPKRAVGAYSARSCLRLAARAAFVLLITFYYGMGSNYEWCVLVREEVTTDYEDLRRRQDELILVFGHSVRVKLIK